MVQRLVDPRAKARAARDAATVLAATSDQARRAGLAAMRDALLGAAPMIREANDADLAAARDLEPPLEPALHDRLRLDNAGLATVVDGLRRLEELADPTGRVLRATLLDHDLRLDQVTFPIGVLACVFESRPDVVVQIAGLAVRSGNAVLLKGGAEAARSNQVLVAAVRRGLTAAGLPADAVQMLDDRAEVQALLAMDDLVDLVIPRGSGELVRHIQESTSIPVLGHAEGVCHIYIDAAADAEKARRIVLDAKLDHPAACNAVEAVLVHRDRRALALDLVDALGAADVLVHLDPELVDEAPAARVVPATQDDDGREYGDKQVLLRLVDDLDGATAHIARHGSGHTDAIVTEDEALQHAFVAAVDSANVFVNASTRFADGYRYGLGAEVGIATGKLPPRGPVGLDGLVTYRWVLTGDGHTAATYRDQAFLHAPAFGPGPWGSA